MPAGELLTVRVPVGGSVADLDTAAEQIAVALELREVGVTRCPDNARQAAVAPARRDLLAGSAPPWPHLAAERLSLPTAAVKLHPALGAGAGRSEHDQAQGFPKRAQAAQRSLAGPVRHR